MRYKKDPISKYDFQDSAEGMINLTPLIDVVFVVLISFMIIAPMLEVENIALASSGSSAKESTKISSNFKIYVKSDNSIWVNNKSVSLLELKKIAHKNFVSKKNPIIFHDEKASFGTYQKIKNLMEVTGFEEMEIALAPNENK
ncbi:MAG: biopolymer transporter ExbD [Chlamydiae bacterium CG10_big_fil_rev_8_21_14_0_10_35_9]|nr:MAG: biopolymer transporter ExbD [Chlamydiae bacterium CG10_big_fil_rev_8_21_14_0_10_35_9]